MTTPVTFSGGAGVPACRTLPHCTHTAAVSALFVPHGGQNIRLLQKRYKGFNTPQCHPYTRSRSNRSAYSKREYAMIKLGVESRGKDNKKECDCYRRRPTIVISLRLRGRPVLPSLKSRRGI